GAHGALSAALALGRTPAGRVVVQGYGADPIAQGYAGIGSGGTGAGSVGSATGFGYLGHIASASALAGTIGAGRASGGKALAITAGAASSSPRARVGVGSAIGDVGAGTSAAARVAP